MELRHLRYFLTVAEELHFRRAAQRLHISQPPLSQQIRDLERELGVTLFIRTSRRVELTEAGAVLRDEARSILRRLDDAVERTRSVSRGDEGRLLLGFVPMAMASFLPAILADFATEHPRFELSLSEMGTNEQLLALRGGRLQIGFPRLAGHRLDGLDHEVVLREPYLLAIPERHPLASHRRVTVEMLEGVNLILSPRPIQPRVYDRIVGSFRDAGIQPRITHEAMSKRACLALVAAAMGVSPITESTKDTGCPGVVYRPIDADWPPLEIAVVWPEGPSIPGLERMLEIVRRHQIIVE